MFSAQAQEKRYPSFCKGYARRNAESVKQAVFSVAQWFAGVLCTA